MATPHSLSALRGTVLFLAVCLALSASAAAQTHNWANGLGGDWDEPLNWSPNGVPNGIGDYPSLSFHAGAPFTVNLNLNIAIDQFLMEGSNTHLSMSGRTIDMSGAGRIGPGTGLHTTMIGSTWNGPGLLDNQADFDALGTSYLGSFLQNGNLRVLGAPAGSSAKLTLGSNTVNHGVIDLTSESGGYASTLIVSPGAFLQNDGYLNFQPGAGGARTFQGHLLNNAPVAVNVNTTFKLGPIDHQIWDFLIAPTATMTVDIGVTTTVSGGLFDIQGRYVQNSGIFNFDGGTVQGTAELINSALNIGASSTNLSSFELYGASSLTGNPVATQTVTVIGAPQGSAATTTIANDINNLGSIVMTSDTGGYQAGIEQATGTTFTNTGLLRSIAGTGGLRNFKGAVHNAGNVQIETPTSFSLGTISNNGTWTITPSGQMNMLAGQDFDMAGGTLTIDGSFTHVSGTNSFLGGAIIGTPTLRHSTIDFDTANFTDMATIRMEGIAHLLTDIPAATTLQLVGAASGSTQTFNVDVPATFAGTTELTSEGGGFTSQLISSAGNSVTNTGTFRSLVGAAGPRTIKGPFTNLGVTELYATTIFSDGPFSNSGTLTIDVGGAMNMLAGQDFDQLAGTMAIDGAFTHVNGTDSFLGGTVTGTPVLRHADLDFDVNNFTGVADFRIEGSSNLLSGVPANTNMMLIGAPSGSTQTLTVKTSAPLAGALDVSSEGGGYTSNLVADVGQTGTNTGSIRFLQGAAGSRALQGDWLNQGTIGVERDTTYSGGTFTNQGDLGITSGATLTLSAGTTFVQESGGIASKGAFVHSNGIDRFVAGKLPALLTLRSSSLEFDPTFVAPIHLRLEGSNDFTGAIQSGQELLLIGVNTGSAQVFTANSGLNSAGNLSLTSLAGGYASSLIVNGGDFVNNGTVQVLAGTGGSRTINATTQNHGIVSIENTTLALQGPAFTNQSSGVVTGVGTIATSSTVLNNQGIFSPGNDIGALAISGDWTQETTGQLKMEVGGLIAGTEHDVLTVSGTANLAGEARLIAANGFIPSFGDQVTILNAGSISGTFDTVRYQGSLGDLHRVELVYMPTSVIAQVVHKYRDIDPVERPLTLEDPVPGVAGQINTFQVSGASGNGTVELVYGSAVGATPVASCSGLDFGIDAAISFGTAPVSMHGNALVQATIPGPLAGTTVYFQAVDLSGCELSNLVSFLLP